MHAVPSDYATLRRTSDISCCKARRRAGCVAKAIFFKHLSVRLQQLVTASVLQFAYKQRVSLVARACDEATYQLRAE